MGIASWCWRLPHTRVIALDRDQDALAAAKARLQENYGDRIQFWQGNFADYSPGDQKFHGIFADLGVSSAQLDQPERGFSFRHEAALDMRMDQTHPQTAAELVNRSSEKKLADMFFLLRRRTTFPTHCQTYRQQPPL